MWKCPKCGREFARANQSHYCGEKPLTVDEYIAQQPEAVQPERAYPSRGGCRGHRLPVWGRTPAQY